MIGLGFRGAQYFVVWDAKPITSASPLLNTLEEGAQGTDTPITGCLSVLNVRSVEMASSKGRGPAKTPKMLGLNENPQEEGVIVVRHPRSLKCAEMGIKISCMAICGKRDQTCNRAQNMFREHLFLIPVLPVDSQELSISRITVEIIYGLGL